MRTTVVLVLLVCLAGGVGWLLLGRVGGVAVSVAPAPGPPLDLPAGGARITLVQRHDADVPGSKGALRVHIGDITRGQVELTMSRRDGTPVIPIRSVRAGDRLEFPSGDRRYRLTVVALNNVLLGNDTAILQFSEGATEMDRIDALLKAIEDSDAVFLRNGTEYSGVEAAAHLRAKLSAAGDRIRTARDFIDQIATRSSTSGEPYQLRYAHGKVMDLATWLDARLDG